MRIRHGRAAASFTLTCAIALAADGCASAGYIGDIGKAKGSGIVSSLFDPANSKPLAPNANRKAHDGGLGTSQTLPSFDSSPLPRTIQAKQIAAPYTSNNEGVTGKLFFFRKGEEDSGNYYVCSGT